VTDEIPDIPRVPDRLREAAQRGTLVPFVGAGASKLADCPGWPEFADAALRHFISLGKFSYSQLAQMAQLGPRIKLSIVRALEEEHQTTVDFAKILTGSQGLHHPLGRRLYDGLGRLARVFVTTNYDSWLDSTGPPSVPVKQANSASGEPSPQITRKIVHKVSDIIPSLLNEDNVAIHLHGSMAEPAGMIMTTQNYVAHYANDRKAGDSLDENRILTFLEYLFSNRTVLFVGYGLEELEILEYVILKAKRILRGATPDSRHFLIQGFFSNQVELYQSLRSYYAAECGIELIPYLRDFRDWAQLVEVIEAFARVAPVSSSLALQDFADMASLAND
jgi:SIR2-like domain